jgi:hypothetical protein
MNSIEEKLWNYIDGSGTAEDRRAISLLIEQDEVYRRKYNELLELNKEFAAIELDEPPMAFTYNVMETIRNENAQIPLKAAINKRIIKGIAAFFVITITVILAIALANVNWHTGSSAAPLKFNIPNILPYITGRYMQVFVFFDVVLGLYLFDAYLRKKASPKNNIVVQTDGQQKQQPE